MQETPPHTLLEIRLLLSQYLDSELTPTEMKVVDGWIASFPAYAEELQKLRKTREVLSTSLGAAGALESPSDSYWNGIMNRLNTDRENPLGDIDPEFVSAYYDGEIPALDESFNAFEGQLYHNPEANRMLAQMGEISETVRRFGYRLETACTLDVTQHIMAAFQAESAPQFQIGQAQDAEIEGISISAEQEMLSAYRDQALSPRETIEANRLIEANPQAREALGRFNQLSEQIQSVSEQIQAQAPDLLPVVSEILRRPAEAGGLVIPIDRFRTAKRALNIAGPIAAAVLLFALLMPASQHSLTPASTPGGHQVAQSVSLSQPQVAEAQAATEEPVVDRQEIASVPTESISANRVSYAATPAEVTVAVPALNSRAASPMRSPAVESLPVTQIAARPASIEISRVEAPTTHKSPSSDEYLFSALNEQMPDGDVASILGK